MGSQGDGMHLHRTATAAVVRAAPAAASSSGALRLGVQGQCVARRRPLVPRPRHLRPHEDVMGAYQPLLWQKWPLLFVGIFLFSAAENLLISAMSVTVRRQGEEE